MENRFFGFVDINDDSSSSFAFVAVPWNSDSSSLRFMRMNSTWLCLDLLPLGRSDALYFHTIILSPPYIRHKISANFLSQRLVMLVIEN